MASTSIASSGDEDVIRFVRFAPWHLYCPGPELEDWICIHVPRGIEPSTCHIPRRVDAAELNARYARTLDELGRCRLRRRPASTLLAHLVHKGDAAADWKRDGVADRHTLRSVTEVSEHLSFL